MMAVRTRRTLRLFLRQRARWVAAAAVVVVVGGSVGGVLGSGGSSHQAPPAPARGLHAPPAAALAFHSGEEAALDRAAALGEAHVLYAKSPGGVLATARRVAHYRRLIDRLAPRAGLDPVMVEALVFLESAGRPDAGAGDAEQAVGLTQIVAETGRDLLDMHIDTARSAALTRRVAHAARHRRPGRVARLIRRRRRADHRFDPRDAIAATLRYLSFARGQLGRDDLAFESYHMGVGNLSTALRDYARAPAGAPIGRVVGAHHLNYTRLFFDSGLDHHARAWHDIARLHDESDIYFFKLLAARHIMALYRHHPAALRREARLQTAKASSENAMHPPDRTTAFASPDALADAYADQTIVPLPAHAARLHLRISRQMGALAHRLHRSRRLYRGLRPGARALLLYLAGRAWTLDAHRGRLTVTSTVRDRDYQELLLSVDDQATPNYSLHTTGWAFDLARLHGRRGRVLRFLLDRLQARHLITWVYEPTAVHVTVSATARFLVPYVGAGPDRRAHMRNTP